MSGCGYGGSGWLLVSRFQSFRGSRLKDLLASGVGLLFNKLFF